MLYVAFLGELFELPRGKLEITISVNRRVHTFNQSDVVFKRQFP